MHKVLIFYKNPKASQNPPPLHSFSQRYAAAKFIFIIGCRGQTPYHASMNSLLPLVS